MKRLRTLSLLVSLLGSVGVPLEAQRPFPYHLQTGREIGLAASGLALMGAGTLIGNGQDPLTPDQVRALDRQDVNAFDRGATRQWSTGASTASDIMAYSLLASPVALMVTRPGSSVPLTIGVMYAETILVGDGLVQLLKTTTGRTRPYAYNDDPAIPQEDKESLHAVRSFPSGHTAHAFMSVVFLNMVYGKLKPDSPLRPWLWAGSLVAAGTVGYLRYDSGNHFPTDILAGAAIGGLAGWMVPRLHETGAPQVSIAPSADRATVLVSLPF
jgi:membrane-associated phospholipid phosphatase